MSIESEYAKLAEEMRQCTACPLCATRTQVVVDRGNPLARLMFVGEAPGQSEDLEGRAFVGAAGQLLDELLAAAGIASDQYLIVNVLKCRPPENKFPGDQGAAYRADIVPKCLGWLEKQLELVRPRVVLLVGKKAAEWTVYRQKRPCPQMHELNGRWIQSDMYPKIEFFGLFHTAYLLRQRQQDPTKAKATEAGMLETLKMAARVLEGELPDVAPIVLRVPHDKTRQQTFW